MAPKKAAKKMPGTAEPKLKAVRLELSEEDHRMLRAVAGNKGLSMAEYARDLVVSSVREEYRILTRGKS